MLRRPRRANPVPQGFTVPGGVAGVCSRLIETDADQVEGVPLGGGGGADLLDLMAADHDGLGG